MTKIYVTAGEPSGDLFGAEVVDALRAVDHDLEIRSAGGGELRARTDAAPIDISPLNVLGIWEGVKAFGDVRRISRDIANDILSYGPDLVVLVDSWGLSLRVARQVRAKNPAIKLVKLVGPQVWATRPGRARTLAGAVDHLMCLHHFEVPFYEPHGLDVTVVGLPALSRRDRQNPDRFRADYDLDPNEDVLLLLPGSRASEISRMGEALVKTGRVLSRSYPELRTVVVPSGNVLAQFNAAFPDLPDDWIVLQDEERRYEAMAAARLALCCSGTVTTELAVQGAPFITGYRIGSISWVIIKYALMKSKFITLLNVAAGKMIAPEFLQGEFNAEQLAGSAERLLADQTLLAQQVADQDDALKKMGHGGEPAPDIAARTILKLLA